MATHKTILQNTVTRKKKVYYLQFPVFLYKFVIKWHKQGTTNQHENISTVKYGGGAS